MGRHAQRPKSPWTWPLIAMVVFMVIVVSATIVAVVTS